MASNGFTKINNSILDNETLSFDSKGVYMTLVRYCSIPGFKINKTHIKSVTGLGEIRFNKAWKELKENNILIQDKKSVNGRFEYAYTLKTGKGTKKTVANTEITPVKKENSSPKPVDSDGNAPLDGQVHITEFLEVAEKQELPASEDITLVTEATGFSSSEALELLKEAYNDTTKVIECHKYSVAQENVRDIFSYTKWAIKNNKALKRKEGYVAKGAFTNYQQRVYDFKKLERALLYGEPYKLPI